MKKWLLLLFTGLLLMLKINGTEEAGHNGISADTKEKQSICRLADSLDLTDNSQLCFSVAGDPVTIGRNETVRSINNHRTLSEKNHYSISKITAKQVKKFHAGQSSDYGRVTVPASMRSRAKDVYIFGLRHILI